MAAKKKQGRPPEPVPADKAEAVLEWIASGKSLASWCRQPGHPALRTVHDWREKDEGFAARFARARETGAEAKIDEAGDIADGTHPISSGDVQRDKLMCEVRFRQAANFAPHRFGTKVQLGGDPTGVPIQTKNEGPQLPDDKTFAEQLRQAARIAGEVLGDDSERSGS